MIARASERFFATSGSYPGSSANFSGGSPQTPSGGGCITPPTEPCPSTRMSMNALRSSVSETARRSSGLSNGGFAGLMIRLRAPLSVVIVQVASATWLLMSRNSGIETPYDKVMSTLSAMNIRLRVATLEFEPVEIWSPRPPVIGVAGQFDVFVRLIFDKFERAGADRVLPHLRGRDVAGIDRRNAGSEQHQKIGLRPFQDKGDFVVPFGHDLIEVAIPRFARI